MAQSINLQITPSGVTPTIYASQFDVGREITFNLYDGPTAYIPPAGSTIRFEGKKSDGNAFSYDCNYTDNVVTVILTDQMTVFAENVTCELRIADINANDIGTLNVILSVEKSPIDGDTSISDTEIPAIVELARAEQYNAEAWAEGTRNGVPVGPTDPTYENNAKYYAEHSSASIANLSDTDIQNLTDGQILKYDSNSGKWVNDDETGGASSLDDLTNVNITTPTNNQVLKYDSVNDEWLNGDAPSGGGMVSHIIVISDAGESSVTVTLPSGTVKTCTQVSGSSTQWETTSDEYGTHTIHAYKDGDDAQASLNIQYVGEYTIHDEHYSHTINVTVMSGAAIVVTGNGETYSGTGTGNAVAFAVHGKEATYTVTTTVDGASAPSQTVTTPATSGQSTSLTFQYGTINLTYDDDFKGKSITCVSGGTTISKTAPSGVNTMAFYPPSTGNWVISGTVSGNTYYASPNPVVVSSLSTSVSASLESLPNGSTVTPTDDIQTWLKCAGIRDKTTYTTLADVLADTDTFIALCADSNACDYMARSTTWASGVTADATAMQIVGMYDYCAEALLSDSTWAEAIGNSEYFESVLNTKVPTMTSNTTPSGTAFASSVYSSAYAAYKAFDSNNSTTYWNAQNNQSYPEYLGYTFTTPVKVSKVRIYIDSTTMRIYTYKIQGSNDGFVSDVHNLTDVITWSNSNPKESVCKFANDSEYTSYRVLMLTGIATAAALLVTELQFYGRTEKGYTGTVIHSAVEDSIYYLDSGSPVTFCGIASGDTGTVLASTIEALKNQTVTLYSSVAKDPTNLSNDYSKAVRITPNVTEIYLMPLKCLYWYGHFDSNCEVCSTANGWDSNVTFNAPTLNKNDAVLSNGSGGTYPRSALGTKNPITMTKMLNISKAVSGSTVNMGTSTPTGTKTTRQANIQSNTATTYTLVQGSVSVTDYLSVKVEGANLSGSLQALWYE